MSTTNNPSPEDDVRAELEHVAPHLSQMKPEDGFNVPHNYFQTLPDQVLQRISEQQDAIPTWQIWWGRVRSQPGLTMALAGAAVLLVAGIWFFGPQSQPDPLGSITDEEALQYVIANVDEFTSEDLLTLDGALRMDAATIQITEENLDEILEDVFLNSHEVFIEDLF
jgi:hypothetical protein